MAVSTMHQRAEGATLAAALGSPDFATYLVAEPADLFSPGPYRHLREALGRLMARGETVDPVTWATEAVAVGLTDGTAAIAGLPDPSTQYVPLLRRLRLQRVAQQLGRRLLQHNQDPGALLTAVADEALSAVAGETLEGISAAAAGLRGWSTAQAGPPGLLKTGLPPLDKALAVAGPGHVLWIGGRPSLGKSSLATQLAQATAEEGKGVLYISLEMTAAALGRRLLAGVSGVPHDRLMQGNLSANHGRLVEAALRRLQGAPLTFLDEPGLTPAQIRAAVLRTRQHHLVDVVIVDYIQLVDIERAGGDELDDYKKMSAVSRELARLARQLGVVVVGCSQLNRPKDGDRPPEPRDLRGSGRLEQDADLILFVHRRSPQELAGTLLLAKNRHGATGQLPVRFDPATVTFRSHS